MMRRDRARNDDTVSGLRTRYYPKSRIGQGLITVGPWIDVVLLIILFLLLNSNLVIEPGVVVDVPRAPFKGGAPFGLIVVVFSVQGPELGSRDEIVFFDDERFLVKEKGQMQDLKQALASQAASGQSPGLLIEADRHVSHGTVVGLMAIAREVGIKRVNVAAREL